jgi:hypothetical protein
MAVSAPFAAKQGMNNMIGAKIARNAPSVARRGQRLMFGATPSVRNADENPAIGLLDQSSPYQGDIIVSPVRTKVRESRLRD